MDGYVSVIIMVFIFWVIWIYRNNVVFGCEVVNFIKIFYIIKNYRDRDGSIRDGIKDYGIIDS